MSSADWYASLPTVYASSSLLLTDPDDRVLMVKPNYRDFWSLPGGMVELGETPDECASREAAEELGLDLKTGALLVIDWVPPEGGRPRVMTNYLFDGGTVTEPELIRLQHDELDAWQFLAWDEATTRMPALTAGRIPAARQARRTGSTIYLPGQRTG